MQSAKTFSIYTPRHAKKSSAMIVQLWHIYSSHHNLLQTFKGFLTFFVLLLLYSNTCNILAIDNTFITAYTITVFYSGKNGAWMKYGCLLILYEVFALQNFQPIDIQYSLTWWYLWYLIGYFIQHFRRTCRRKIWILTYNKSFRAKMHIRGYRITATIRSVCSIRAYNLQFQNLNELVRNAHNKIPARKF